jgi:TPR repeat protein
VNWLRKAADQGFAKAQSYLGSLYAEGRGVVPQDYVLAHMWSNLAAARFSEVDIDSLEDAAKVRDRVASKMPPAQLEEAQRLAREWKPDSQ